MPREERTEEIRRGLTEALQGADYDTLVAMEDTYNQAQMGLPTWLDPDARETMQLLNDDLRTAARTMSPKEARYNVDLFYQTQDIRKRAREQVRSMEEEPEPHKFLEFVYSNANKLERRIYTAMDEYSSGRVVGRWSKLNFGIGPVLAAGFMAGIDITKAPTVGHIWRFCGQDPTVEWLGKVRGEALVKEICGSRGWTTRVVTEEQLIQVANEVNRKLGNLRALAVDPKKDDGIITAKLLAAAVAKRPYSHSMHVLCWKLGDVLFKFHNKPQCFYGGLIAHRWDIEKQRNEAGNFREQAERKLATTDIGHATEAYKWYSEGKLPPSRILLRAERWGVKIFLAHWHAIEYRDHFGREAPKPYALTLEGHDTPIEIPNWPLD